MEIHNVHERLVPGAPGEVARLVGDFDEIWPDDVARAPRYYGDGMYAVGPMVWQEVVRADAARAFRVIHPPELEAEHWFEVRPASGGTLVRHVVVGEARAELADVWRDRLEAVHDRILEALLHRIAAKSAEVTVSRREGS